MGLILSVLEEAGDLFGKRSELRVRTEIESHFCRLPRLGDCLTVSLSLSFFTCQRSFEYDFTTLEICENWRISEIAGGISRCIKNRFEVKEFEYIRILIKLVAVGMF